MATKEAAFRAYVRLYDAGLINKNLLPEALPDPVMLSSEMETEEEGSVICVRGRTMPWTQAFGNGESVYRQTLTIRTQFSEGEELPCLHLFLPSVLDISMAFRMFWTNEQFINVEIGPERFAGDFLPDQELLSLAHLSTERLFESIFLGKMQMRSELSQRSPFLMVPYLEATSLRKWLTECTGDTPAENFDELRPECGLIRLKSSSKAARPYLFRSLAFKARDPHWASESTGLQQPGIQEAHFEVKRLPKRLDYLHPPNYKEFNTSIELVPAAECYVDRFPTAYAKLMLLFPSILHKMEIRIVAMALNRNVLSSIGFELLELVENAICASAANESCNYQRLELIGDSILKFWTSAQLCAQFPGWHEGYLSKGKDRVVSNSHLCRASRDHGLDKYIHTEPFASSRWSLPTVDVGIGDEAIKPQRNMSSKVLADVVEALIGASFLDSRDEQTRNLKVQACLALFLGGISWRSPIDNASILKDLVPKQCPAFENFRPLTEITGFSFDKKILLIEALTHPSHPPVGIQGSYQRLEFLGDSILDFVVVETMAKHSRDISHFTMHLIRAAVVNADFLAFLCLGAGLEQDRAEVTTERTTGIVEIRTTKRETYLWEFMKHSGKLELLEAQKACAKRYHDLKLAINAALDHGRAHPWHLLLCLNAQKFFSDIIESILGAIFIDSNDNLQACKEFLERLGLMKYLRRVITGNVDTMHPKERLGIVAGNAKVRYETTRKIVNDAAQYSCTVFVDDESTATSADEVSRAAAEAKAAQDAVGLVSEARVNSVRKAKEVDA
jgi:dsRNA-specific ribonuclease